MAHSTHGTDGAVGHILPFSTYVNTLAALLFLTVITVVASRIDFGDGNFVVAMAIASVKAAIVGLFFMHLKYEGPFIWACLLVPIVLLFILLIGLFIDNPLRTGASMKQTFPATQKP
jgi:cytochrome c oxidase subunit 4